MIIIGWLFDALFKKKAKVEKNLDRLAEFKKKSATSRPESGSAGSPSTASKAITLEEIFARAGSKTKAQSRPSSPQKIHRQIFQPVPPAPVAALAQAPVAVEQEPVADKKEMETAAAKSAPPSVGCILPVPANLLPWQQAIILHEILLAPVSQRMKNQKHMMMQYSACRGGKGN